MAEGVSSNFPKETSGRLPEKVKVIKVVMSRAYHVVVAEYITSMIQYIDGE